LVASAATVPKSRSDDDVRLSDLRTMPRALAVAVADDAAIAGVAATRVAARAAIETM
jgi:hypothetical protein